MYIHIYIYCICAFAVFGWRCICSRCLPKGEASYPPSVFGGVAVRARAVGEERDPAVHTHIDQANLRYKEPFFCPHEKGYVTFNRGI